MYCTTQISKDLYYIGGSDRRLHLFENIYPLNNGVSYNSYILCDEKTVLFDTVDKSVSGLFFENLAHILGDRKLDYLIVNHMEPDHCATIGEVVLRYPDVKLIGNYKTFNMLNQFFDFDVSQRFVEIKEGDIINTGCHDLTFVMAPMVHWPEAMVTYDITTKTLFSADAFGTFGALNGNIFADAYNFEVDILPDARRYYTNIVGKYGQQVQTLLKKASKIEINMICPLHGPIWRKDISKFISKYADWSSYKPEENAVMIAYGSIYGGTENAANILATELANLGVKNIVVYDVSNTDPSYIVAEAFRCSHLVFASSTYNANIFTKMETVLHDISQHNLQKRTVAFIENGTWAMTSGKLMRNIFENMKDINIIDSTVSIDSTVKEDKREELVNLAKAIVDTMVNRTATINNERKIDNDALFSISYGLFVLSVKDNDKNNGCIINTAVQITDTPKQLMIAVNKANLTHDILMKTKVCNLSVLNQDVPFNIFEHFGFNTGRSIEKFTDVDFTDTTENGLRYVKNYSNAVISGNVVATQDMGTHTMFTVEVTEAKKLNYVPSVTYTYYLSNIKPKPQAIDENQSGWVCKLCGYIYEGDNLPADFICPLCKHGIDEFERL